jgi:acyl-CoA reductase-like NAD-dependent aldehyde dehydrogenase
MEPKEVELAISRARQAQPAWACRPFRDRAPILLRFHDLLLKRQDAVLDLIFAETGKPRRHAFEEVLDTATVSRYYAFHAHRHLRPRRRRGALPLLTKTWEFRVPLGVVGFITPWNFPFSLAMTDLIPALMAGNAAVLKPDPQTTQTAQWGVDLLREAGLPPDVLTVVTGDPPLVGPALVASVDYVMFTGSTRTGALVARQAAERLIGCSLELGGKNPMIVLADADLDKAVDGAVRACFPAAGQVCVSMERIYVHESIYDRFVAEFAASTKGLDLARDVGRLISERQLAAVQMHVRDAVEKGASVAAGGRPRPDVGPLYYEPTILLGVHEGMTVHAQETFGPVVSVYPFANEEDAIERANSTPYGLNASVWTRSARAGFAIARRIRAGSVNINEAYAATWGSVDAPMGGMKQSGLRPRHGAEGIVKFTDAQTVAVQRLIPLAPTPGMTPDRFARLLTRLLMLLRYIRVLG